MFSDLSAQKDSSVLCRPPGEEQGPVFDRVSLAYSSCSGRYKVGDRSFSRQYAHIYAARLMEMRPLLTDRAQQKWGEFWISTPHQSETFVHCLPINQSFSSVSLRIRCADQEAV